MKLQYLFLNGFLSAYGGLALREIQKTPLQFAGVEKTADYWSSLQINCPEGRKSLLKPLSV
jgi:hypothetical protein